MTDIRKLLNMDIVSEAPKGSTPSYVLNAVNSLIVDELLDDEWAFEDIDLDSAQAGDTYLGLLNNDERLAFMAWYFLKAQCNEIESEVENEVAPQMQQWLQSQRRILRRDEVQAAFNRILGERIDDEFSSKLFFMCNYMRGLFEHTVRMRFNVWSGEIDVRVGGVLVHVK